MKVTAQDYEAKIAQSYRVIAGEDIEARYIAGTTYFLGSELATLRLFKFLTKFHHSVPVDHGKSGIRDFYCKVDFNNQFITIEED